MAEKSRFKALITRLPAAQPMIMWSWGGVLLLAMVGGFLLFKSQLAVQRQVILMQTEYTLFYKIAALTREHFQLYEASQVEASQLDEPFIQQQLKRINSQLDDLKNSYPNPGADAAVRDLIEVYAAEWTALQPFLAKTATPSDFEATQPALLGKLQAMTLVLDHALVASQLAMKTQEATLRNRWSFLTKLLVCTTLLFLIVALLTGYSFFLFSRERRHTKDAMTARDHRYRALLEAIPDAVLRRTRDGTYTDFKPAKGFGRFMPSADFIGKHISAILPPPVVEQSMAASERALATGEEQTYEYQMAHRQTGLLRDYEARVSVSGVDEVQVIIRDITEEKVHEERLHQAQKLESLGMLAGGVAHDFNNLLTGMMAQNSLARFKLARGLPALAHIDKAIVSVERAADLTRQLLAYAGKGKFQIITLDLNHLIRETTGLLEAALPNRDQLQLHLSDPLPLIEADRGQIQQVVMNLVINGAEALQDDGGYVRIITASRTLALTDDASSYLGAKLAPGSYVALQVDDNGVGMDQKTLTRIFDPFFSTKTQGHGLGLAATLGIMRTHHGGIQVQSQVGDGTTFTLLFPAVAAPPAPPITADAWVASRYRVQSHVLVIDDEPAIREAVSDILTAEGLEVTVAPNGAEGIECYQQQQREIGLVLLDMKMPGLSGEETFRALRQIDPQVKVIISSGYNETEINCHFQETEIVAFLPKPYNVALLIEHVQAVLGKELLPAAPVPTA